MPPKKRTTTTATAAAAAATTAESDDNVVLPTSAAKKACKGASASSASSSSASSSQKVTPEMIAACSANDPLRIVPLFQGGEDWLPLLKPVIEKQANAADFIGPSRASTIVPVRELTFQALKPNPPENWNVVVFGQNPYPRVESATGIAMFDNTFADWNDSRFGKVTSMRCIIKAACIWKYGIAKDTSVAEIRTMLKKNKIVAPDEWFQAMLTQGCLLLNAALTASTDSSLSTSKHTTFWRPVVRQIIEEILKAKSQSKKGVVFAWWGSHAQFLRRYVDELNEIYNVPVEHIDHNNPAAMGDMFCAGNHFKVVNDALKKLSLPEIDFLPEVGWNKGGDMGSRSADIERMGRFISDTKELHKMYLERLQGARDEKGEELDAIVGIKSQPVKSFTEATKSLVGVVAGIQPYLERSLKYASSKTSSANKLSSDEVAALHLYTLESAFYRNINAALRDKDRTKISPYFPYLRLFLSAMEKMEPNHGTLWRGVALDLAYQYPMGSTVTWWGVSSCTVKLSVAQSFLGSSGKRTLFEVKPASAISISDFSAFSGEAEYILSPGTQLRVDKVVSKPGGLTEVHLSEIVGATQVR